jgi:hypothetical protein
LLILLFLQRTCRNGTMTSPPTATRQTPQRGHRIRIHMLTMSILPSHSPLFACPFMLYLYPSVRRCDSYRINYQRSLHQHCASWATDIRTIGRYASFSEYLLAILPFLLSSYSMNAPATDLQYALLAIAMLQCPLHIYSIFALRASNEHSLEGGSERNGDWVRLQRWCF